MGKIIAVSNQKGGVGKTSTAINLAYGLSEKGKKVLLCDIDSQGNATTGLGGNKGSLDRSVYDVIMGEADCKQTIIKTQFKNLYLLPSHMDLAGAEVELVPMKHREKRLANALAEIKDEYDYILLDCPPAISLLTVNGLAAADGVLIPIQSEYYALEGLAQLMNTIKLVKKGLNPSLEIEGVLITMYDKRALVTRQICDEIRKFFGNRVYQTVIPRNIRVSEAPSHGVPLMVHDKKCKGSVAYYQFTEEFLGRNK